MRQTLREVLRLAAARLEGRSDSPGLDAEILLAHVLGRPRSHLHAWPEAELDEAAALRFSALIEHRAAGKPVAHLVGQREFWSLPLEVTPDTLIPRPETELLVEALLERLPAGQPAHILDLGTGSGAIALAVRHERPLWTVTAVERAPAALAVARRNARRLGLTIDWREGNWFVPVSGERFTAIVSNPPYVAEADPHLDQGDVRHEPRAALAAGPEGLDDLEHIISGAPAHLEPGGWLLLEHGMDQAEAVASLLKSRGFEEIRCLRDLAGLDRVSLGRMGRPGE
ncbi:peptide chain release factor N(5)-glutamine methyltransferase [Thiohalobacter sp.]|uniref:peptide chain release factor N(5)-glutamine methyltransferase n=1 Tax=Thiohalobacter sp. TaxID=2025948 RepID=UPI002634FA66|nr:peptide chain release factor N(5)-glutamine methyltransferase [Thiohalobacter sp.]